MRSLYIAATEESAGKTTLAVGLCLALRERGIDAGYFKPVGLADGSDAARPDADAAFVAGVLGLASLAHTCFTVVYCLHPRERAVQRKQQAAGSVGNRGR